MADCPFEALLWLDDAVHPQEGLAPEAAYQQLVRWAARARGQNPAAFDRVTLWLGDDRCWTPARLEESAALLASYLPDRFLRQNAALRARLTALAPAGVVNEAVFRALEQFDAALAGNVPDNAVAEAAARVSADIRALGDPAVRRLYAGCATGPSGTDSVPVFGYINMLKECDAVVQWALFMPDQVKAQQQGFQVESFSYQSMPAMRFLGREGDELADPGVRKALFRQLDEMTDSRSGFDDDLLFMHHNGQGVDVGVWHGLWGRFMRADTPAPPGFTAIDLVPADNRLPGAPYLSQFAHAVFSGDEKALHRREGYDSDAMYDVTRNIILGQGVIIPYPEKYWTAEVFPDGCDKPSRAYLFSALL